MDTHIFADRADAGRQLGRLVADSLGPDQRRTRPMVLALPRGGVEVGAHVADAIDADLDVVVARKVGAPGNLELAVGAVTVSGPVFWNSHLLSMLGLRPDELVDRVTVERTEARRRLHRYRGDHTLVLRDRTVLVVDDGLATGATAIAALGEVRMYHPSRLILAVPVGAPDRIEALRAEADEVWCVLRPERLRSVGEWYARFPQLSDDQVERILAEYGTLQRR
jgi:putative phosphoribosyl transferase